MAGASLEIHLRDLAGTMVVEPVGVLNVAEYAGLRDTLLKAGIDEPRAVIVDLDRLALPDAAVALFTSVAEQLDRWPGVRLLLAARERAQRSALARSGVPRFVPVYLSVTAAVAAVGDPPLRRIARRTLPNAHGAAGIARLFAREMCVRWGLTCTESAISIANELVENTLVHTYCTPSMRMELRRGLLTVAVYDDDPARPEPGDDGPRRGLRIVGHLASAWGSAPTASGGKVVWAVVRARPDRVG